MRALVWLLLLGSAWVQAASEQALSLLTHISADPARYSAALEAGRERTRLCGHCHGVDGNSKRAHIPNLAAQHPLYLFNAFEQFATGARNDFVMSKLAQNLSLEDQVNIALYYAAQQVRPSAAAPGAARAEGQALFTKVCANCHGQKGQGFATLPRLAGQSETYVARALTRFKTGDASRSNSVMQGIAQALSEAEIGALAAFVAQLNED